MTAGMHDPPRAGGTPRELCLEPLGLPVTDAATGLGVSGTTLSSSSSGRAGISPAIAVCLSTALDTSTVVWLDQQLQHELWQAETRRESLRVARAAA